MVTIREIAREANVAISTVSNVLNKPADQVKASAATRKRILEIARKHQYVPSMLGKGLREGRSYTIGMLGQIGFYDSYTAKSLYGASEVLRCAGYSLELTPSVHSAFLREEVRRRAEGPASGAVSTASYHLVSDMPQYLPELREAIQRLLQRGVDGVLLTEEIDEHNREIFAALSRQVPMVKLFSVSGIPELPSVYVDPVTIGELGAELLYQLGHRRIVLLGSRPKVEDTLRAFLARYGVVFAADRVLAGYRDFEGGRAALRRILETMPDTTAVFCYNDTNAAGVLYEAQRIGLRIPEDLSVLGVNNLDISEQLYPRLTTIMVPHSGQGAAAAELLLARIAGEKVADRILAPALIERESCGVPRAQERLLPRKI